MKKKALRKTKKFIKIKKIRNVQLIVIHSRKYCKILASANYLINNRGFASYFIKKEGQVYIQTWHGTPLKGLGKDAKDAPDDGGNFQKNCFMTDYFIMPNDYSLKKIKQGYMIDNYYSGKFLMSGYPRNIIFLDEEYRSLIRNNLLLKDKKVFVYMPTWRRNKLKENYLDIEVVNFFEKFEKENDGKSILYVKLHSLLKEKINFDNYKFIKEFPDEYETYEFLCAADCLITDYSSVFFDFALSKRKIVLFAYDKEKYCKSISTYFSLDNLPFPIVSSADELLNELKFGNKINFDEFLSKFTYLENKNTAKEICNYIFKNKQPKFEIIDSKPINNNILIYLGNFEKNDALNNFLKIINDDIFKNKNVVAFFNKNKVRKNKLLINSFSDKVDFIAYSGAKNMTFSEGVAVVLFKRFSLWNCWIKSKIYNVYKREVKRRFGSIVFEKVIDLSPDSIDNINLYKYMNEKKIIILHKSFLIPRKGKKLKMMFYKNKFEQIYLNDNGSLCKVSFDKDGKMKMENKKVVFKARFFRGDME